MTRDKAKEIISYHKYLVDKDTSGLLDKQLEYQAIDMAIKALEQEPFINKPCISSEVCEHDKQKVLDKIRAEIENINTSYYSSVNGVDMTECADDIKHGILQILDKYKAESEG
jgi:hypothetical protein